MPELPEVETVRKGLEESLANFLIYKLEVLSERSIASKGGSKEFISRMRGLLIGTWKRRGKYLIANLLKTQANGDFIDAGSWVIHLRMTGFFEWEPKKKSPCPHTRVRLWNKKGTEIRFVDVRNFGQMWWIPPNQIPNEVIKGLKRLGPEPLSKEFSPKYLKQCLTNRKRSIKSSLLDQALIAGIGNIYADESLFAAGIKPIKESRKLNSQEINKLFKSIINVLEISIGKGGMTFSDFRDLKGLNGNYGGEAWVYRRTNMPCRICRSTILKNKIAGRSTHWCPMCQK